MKQDKIWDYFQGEGVDNFDQAVPRLNYLFRRARKLSDGRRLRVLNIGTGNGWLERRCLREGWETHALDPSEEAVRKLTADGINAKAGYAEAMPHGAESFDVVFCSEVLEHLSDEQLDASLGEIQRVLAKGGYLIGTVPFNEDLRESIVVCPDCGKVFHRWGHQQSFDRGRLRSKIGGCNLTTLSVFTYAFPVYSKPWPLNRLLQWLRRILGRIAPALVYSNLFFLAKK